MNDNKKAIEILKLYKQRLEESVSTELGNDIKAFGMAISALEQTDGDLISRNDVINMFNTMDRYRADKLILQDTDREFPSNEVFIVDDCYELLEQLPTYSTEQTDGDLISRTDLLKELKKWDWQDAYLPIHFAELVADLPSAEQTDSVLEDMKAEFIKRYPLNYCGEPELGGVSCVFSLNEVLKIIDRHISRKEGD